MLSPIRGRAVLLILACWALANALVYFGLRDQPGKSGSHRRPSQRTLSLYMASQYRRVDSGSSIRESLPYRLLSPVNLIPDTQYPLVVFLHGAGEKGDDNQLQLLGLPEQMAESRWQKRFPCYLLAPQCSPDFHWSNHEEDLVALIRQLRGQQAVDPQRIYLTGLSMGGFGCWSLAAREPDLFAAVVPICGGGEPSTAERLVGVPIWAVHGDADDAVPVQYSRDMIAAIRRAGGTPAYSELKGVGHDSWTQTYRDPDGVLKWMFEQRQASDESRSTH